jgi:hypothetical protein
MHLIGMHLIGLHLTGMCLMGVYLIPFGDDRDVFQALIYSIADGVRVPGVNSTPLRLEI